MSPSFHSCSRISRKADPYVRLRVPLYLKFFDAVFFVSFLALYYAVLVPIQRSGRSPKIPPFQVIIEQQSFKANNAMSGFHSITTPEILLYIWIAGFAYDECRPNISLNSSTATYSRSWRVQRCRASILCYRFLEFVGPWHGCYWSSFLYLP